MKFRALLSFVVSAALVTGAVVFVFSPGSFAQQSATLSASPGSGTYANGATFSVAVRVNSGGSPGINAAEAQMAFDKAKLQVTGIGKSGSIFSLWPSEPAFSNADGSITFAGGSPTAYTGNSGTIISVTFRAIAAGTADVTFKSGSVLAADGKGTNVLGQTVKGTYTIGGSAPPPAPAPGTPPGSSSSSRPAAPEIESPTHPSPDTWYAKNDVELRWTLPIGVLGISSAFDANPTAEPPQRSEGISENTLFENVNDGIWFYHLRFQNGAGWGPTTHRRVLVDTKEPNPFDVSVTQSRATDPTPELRFLATDDLSGVARYEVQAGPGDPRVITPPELAAAGGSMTVGPLIPGSSTITVTAIDGAGNRRVSTAQMKVDPIPLPTIAEYSKEVYDRSIFYAIGGGPERGRILIRLSDPDGETFEGEALTDADGRWFYIRRDMPRGTYELTAKAFDQEGAQSNFTDPLLVEVRSTPILIRFSWLIILILILGVIGLTGLIFYERREHAKTISRIKAEVGDMRERLRDVFAALHEETEEKVKDFDKRPSLSDREKQILDALEEALEISEELVGKEVADVEQLLE